VAALAGPGAAAARAAETSAWTQFQGGGAHLGLAPSGTVEPPYERAWRFRAPGKDRGVAGPVLVDGLAIAAGRDAVYAVDLASGRLRWSVPRNNGFLVASPAVASTDNGDVLLFVEGRRVKDAMLRAYDVAGQQSLWQLHLSDVSIAGVSADGQRAFVGDRSGTVYAVDVADGTEAWRFSTADEGVVEGGGVVDATPAVVDGRVLAFVRNTTSGAVAVVALDEETGKLDWTFSPSQPVGFGSGLTVAGDTVYVGLGDQLLYALDAADGAQRWSSSVPSAFFPLTSAAVADGAVYAVATLPTANEAGVYRFDAADGTRRWWFELSSADLDSSPLLVGRFVLVGLNAGALVAIDAESGERVWQGRTGKGALGPMAPAGDLLILGKVGGAGGLIALRHDPDGVLTADPSPTDPDPVGTLRDYALAAAAVGGGVVGLGLLLERFARRRPQTREEDGPEDEGLPDDEDEA
jgi:eukaryotic-like serine/threonine-protein kinase